MQETLFCKGQDVYVRDIRSYVFSLMNKLDADEGILFGQPDTPVHRVMICWMADLDAINYAIAHQADTILCHEILYYPSDVLNTGHTPEFLSWRVNHQRVTRLAQGGLSVVRAHMNLDRTCILDDFADKLGLGKPIASEPDLAYVYAGGKTVREYLQTVQKAFNMRCVRYTSRDLDRVVNKIGLPWGGLGISRNIRYMEQLVRMGCDLFIAGETENYAMHYAKDSGLDMIETGHELSENPGLRHFCDMFRQAFPQLDVFFYENPQAFQYFMAP